MNINFGFIYLSIYLCSDLFTIVFTIFVVCTDGAAYCLGTVNRDCWYLYTLHPLHGRSGELRRVGPAEPDQTLEILMSDLDPAVMSIFTREECSSAAEATQVKVCPGVMWAMFNLSTVDAPNNFYQ